MPFDDYVPPRPDRPERPEDIRKMAEDIIFGKMREVLGREATTVEKLKAEGALGKLVEMIEKRL